jgi:HK97 family phage major capsid protein
MNPKLKAAREAYADACKRMADAADAYENAPEDATDEQLGDLSAAFDTAKAEAERCKREVERIEEILEARASHPVPGEPAPEPEPRGDRLEVNEPATYSRTNTRDSFFLDLARAQTRTGLTADVEKRLERHRKEMTDEVERRNRIAEQRFSTELDGMVNELLKGLPLAQQLRVYRAIEMVGLVEKRTTTRIDGSAGEFVPPVWMLDEYAEFARAGRPFADAVRAIPLPDNTDSISIPRITQGHLTGFQTQDAQALASQDLQSAMVTAPVRTAGGYADYALQVLEQSPIAFDQLIFEDLFADMDMRIDLGCISGDGGPGNFLGILNTAGINSISYTDGTPTVPELYPKLADSLNQAAAARKRVPTHFWWATRRWFWAAKELDSSNRPYFIAASNGPNNAVGIVEAVPVEGGPVTNAFAVPVNIDNNIPTNLGGGTNEDRIIATRMADHVLLEGGIRAEAFREPLSDKVGIRFRVYKYAAFTAGRFPAGTSVVSGTGLVTPTF